MGTRSRTGSNNPDHNVHAKNKTVASCSHHAREDLNPDEVQLV
jgi:hypothetical protein